MLSRIENGEGTFFSGDVCGFVVGPELDLLHCPFGKLDSFVAIVPERELAEHVGKPHNAQTDPSVLALPPLPAL